MLTSMQKKQINNIELKTMFDITKYISECEHRDLIKEADGSLREETDEEFRKRIKDKLNDIENDQKSEERC